MIEYSPLKISDAAEDESDRTRTWYRVLRWFDERVPLVLTPRIPHGRRSITHQLQLRPAFPDEAWMLKGCDEKLLFRILQVFERELDLPNCNLVPSDPLVVLMRCPPSQHDFPESDISRELDKLLGPDKRGECMHIFEQMFADPASTIGDFVVALCSKCSA